MPIFEYQCSDCGNKFEELVSSSEARAACPKCESENTKKLLSVFAASAGSSSAGPACSTGGCGGSGFS